MNRLHYREQRAGAQRGQALVVALALVLCLTLLVAATQLQVVSQLGLSLPERDYERALFVVRRTKSQIAVCALLTILV